MASSSRIHEAQQICQLLAQLPTGDATHRGKGPSKSALKAAEHTLAHHSFAEVNPRVVDTNVEGLLQMFALHAHHSKKQAAEQLIERCAFGKCFSLYSASADPRSFFRIAPDSGPFWELIGMICRLKSLSAETGQDHYKILAFLLNTSVRPIHSTWSQDSANDVLAKTAPVPPAPQEAMPEDDQSSASSLGAYNAAWQEDDVFSDDSTDCNSNASRPAAATHAPDDHQHPLAPTTPELPCALAPRCFPDVDTLKRLPNPITQPDLPLPFLDADERMHDASCPGDLVESLHRQRNPLWSPDDLLCFTEAAVAHQSLSLLLVCGPLLPWSLMQRHSSMVMRMALLHGISSLLSMRPVHLTQ